jgi:hypothetical protein
MNLAHIIGNLVTGKNLAMREAPTRIMPQEGDLALATGSLENAPNGGVGGVDLLSKRPG